MAGTMHAREQFEQPGEKRGATRSGALHCSAREVTKTRRLVRSPRHVRSPVCYSSTHKSPD
eukprot:1010415-Pleurochrysis_carterae.AAC.1